MNNKKVLSPNIHHQLKILGFSFLVMTVITSFFLYSSFGFTVTEKAVYAALGVLLSVSTAFMLSASYTLWVNQNAVLAVIAFLIYVSLFFIEFNTSLGFMATAQENYKANSATSAIKKEILSDARANVKSMSKYHGVNAGALEEKKKALYNKAIKAQVSLDGCPATWVKNCIKPKQAALDELERKLSTVDNDIKGAQAYAQAVDIKGDALKAVSSISSVGGAHPLFEAQSTLTGGNAAKMQAVFLAFSSFIITALTSILFLFSSVLEKRFIVLPVKTASMAEKMAGGVQKKH